VETSGNKWKQVELSGIEVELCFTGIVRMADAA